LGSVENEIREIIKKEDVKVLENDGITGIIYMKYPILFEKKKQTEELYRKYSDELIGIEGLREDDGIKNQVEVLSSVYQVKTKSKAKLILALGIVLGLFMGVFVAFIREFFKGIDFKKRIISFK
jgi:hypothetical protein